MAAEEAAFSTGLSEAEVSWNEQVHRIARGDSEALAKLYDGTSGLVYSLALRILADPADAEEVTLDVYTQVWRTAGRFDEQRGNATAWLLLMARSRAIDRLRAESGRQSCEAELSHHQETDLAEWQQDEDPARLAIADENSRLVAAALEELSSAQRQALQLAYFDGLTHREIAAKLGAPLGSVKTHIRTGLARLGRALRALDTNWTDR